MGDPRSTDALWTLVNFKDDRDYPQDALLRHQAMSALLRIALAANQRQSRAGKAKMMLN